MTEWVAVAKVDDLPEGAMIGATIEGVDVLVANLGGHYRAIGSECTHASCDLHDGELDAERRRDVRLPREHVRPRHRRRGGAARGRARARLSGARRRRRTTGRETRMTNAPATSRSSILMGACTAS